MSNNALFDVSPLEQVREGMSVMDDSGKRLGTVKRVRMADRGAVTAAGQTSAGGSAAVVVAPASSPGGTTAFGGVAPVLEANDSPDVPDPPRTRLLRVGFIELKDSELHGTDAYIPGDRIAQVSGDTVRLGRQPVADSAPTEANEQYNGSGSTRTGEEAMFRTRVGTPEYEVHSSGIDRRVLWGAGGATLLIGGGAGVWIYRWRQRRARPDARLRRLMKSWTEPLQDNVPATVGGAGGVFLTLMLLRAALKAFRGSPAARPRIDSARSVLNPELQQDRQRGMFRVLVPVLAIGGLAIALRRRRRDDRPMYIGTPGVESASGRDRVRSGELPPEYGSEAGR